MKERINISLESEIIGQLRKDSIEKYGKMRSVSRLIEDLVKANTEDVDIDAKIMDREEFIIGNIETRKAQRKGRTCGMQYTALYICDACKAQFETIRMDAKYCPSCRGANIRVMLEEHNGVGAIDGDVPLNEIGMHARINMMLGNEDDRKRERK
ncbi:MAG: hypothetical protein WCX48_11065, partial [Bacteroidales bacterium]